MKNTAARFASRRPFAPARSARIDPTWTGANTVALGQLMQTHPNFASLGAIGPDLFFFLPDFRNTDGVSTSSVLVTVLNFLEELYNALDPYISKWEQYLGPISEDTGEEMSRLTGGLSETVGDITGELSSLLITAIENYVTENVDFWTYFSLGLNKGYDEQAFFWSDMLHYRDTGQFARAIWKSANDANDDQARAYALGYNTHVATDVTGHAFVNSIAGGPFRLHWQRHHLVENHMDTFWYLKDPLSPSSGDQYPQLTESALYYDIAFAEDGSGNAVNRPPYPTGGTMRENWIRRRLLDIDSKMPEGLANLLIQAMADTFYARPDPGEQHPKILSADGRPSVALIQEAYDLLFRYLKYSTVDGFSHEPPDPPNVFPNLNFPTISDPAGDAAPGAADGGSFWDDLLDFLLSIVEVIIYIAEVAAYLATLPWAVLADLTTYPLRLGLYYALELPLFHLLKSFRAFLVMTGYMLPMEDEVAQFLTQIGNSNSGTFNQVLQLDGDVFAGFLPPPESRDRDQTYRDSQYPHAIPLMDPNKPLDNSSNPPMEFHAPWSYPSVLPFPPNVPDGVPQEQHLTQFSKETAPGAPLATTAGPHAAGSTPAVLFGGTGTDPSLRDRFEAAATAGDSDVVGQDVTPNRHLGDVVAFSEYLLWLETRDPIQRENKAKVPLVEWNLDSDMGYGYHCWDWNRNPNPALSQPDPEGNEFLEPCTWPAQADSSSDPEAAQSLWVPSVRLQVHWVGPGLEDPGCQPPPAPPPMRTMVASKKSAVAGGKAKTKSQTASIQ